MLNKSKLVGVFDIETTTLDDGTSFAYAFTCLETDNIEDVSRETLTIKRTEEVVVKWLERLGCEGANEEYTPIVASYNLSFDFAGIANGVNSRYYVHEIRSSSGLLAIDLYTNSANIAEETPFLRFWNVQPFVPRGLKYMGELVGQEKKTGCLDYALIRSRETPLTREEEEYCKRDVKIISEFLRFLLASFDWLRAGDLGRVCLTPASVIRLYQNRYVGTVKSGAKNLAQEWHALTHSDRENSSEEQRLLRREAYAGGFTFTTPASYFREVENVHVYDMDSAYHFALVNLPTTTDFQLVNPESLPALKLMIEKHLDEPLNIKEPLGRIRGHFRITFTNIRPNSGVWSAAAGVGYLSARRASRKARLILNATGEDTAKITATGLVESFGRIIAAKTLTLTVDEYELAAIRLAYVWDDIHLEAAEVATRKTPRSSFVRLSSLMLREMKKERKAIGGPEYDLFKTVYNSQAGIYAELEREGFTLAYLPTAVRQTSFTRLSLFLAAQFCANEGCRIVSGDTDSLRVSGTRDAVERALKLHSEMLKTMSVQPTDLENDITGEQLTASYDGLGEFKHETTATVLKEMGAKARAWIELDAEGREVFRIKHAGLNTDRLEQLANNGTRKPREWLDDMKPFTWIAPHIAKNVTRHSPTSPSREVSAVDYRGEAFKLTASPCITLKDELVCLALPTGETAKRLKQAQLLDKVKEGYLDENGTKPLL